MSPYDVLGVSPDASQAEIRRAYLSLARRHHPDAGGDADDMRRLNEAWAALSAPPTPSHVQSHVKTTGERTCDAGDEAESGVEDDSDSWDVGPVRRASPRLRLMDNLTLLATLACVASAALSFLFGMLFESGPLLGFCVFSLFLVGILVVARTLLAMGFDRGSVR
jgi:curved DNA-binding protein CbpA